MDACDAVALGSICTGITRGDWVALATAILILLFAGLGLLWLMHDIMGGRK